MNRKCTICRTELSLDKFNKKPNGELTKGCTDCLVKIKAYKKKYLCTHNLQVAECRYCNINGALRKSIMIRIRKFSKLNFDVFGCSIDEYKLYLESKFDKGMSFQNYGYWLIFQKDYIKPSDSEDQIKTKLHYTNTRPLWVKDLD